MDTYQDKINLLSESLRNLARKAACIIAESEGLDKESRARIDQHNTQLVDFAHTGYSVGMKDSQEGVSLKGNPYIKLDPRHVAWIDGWYAKKGVLCVGGEIEDNQPKGPLIKIRLPTGGERFVTKILRDDAGKIVDASYSIYPPQPALKTTVQELSTALPGYNFFYKEY